MRHKNAYLVAKFWEKIYTIDGPESGSDSGKTIIFEMVLYGSKYGGEEFRYMLYETFWGLGFHPNRADLDV